MSGKANITEGGDQAIHQAECEDLLTGKMDLSFFFFFFVFGTTKQEAQSLQINWCSGQSRIQSILISVVVLLPNLLQEQKETAVSASYKKK